MGSKSSEVVLKMHESCCTNPGNLAGTKSANLRQLSLPEGPHIIRYTSNTSVTDEYFPALEASFHF